MDVRRQRHVVRFGQAEAEQGNDDAITGEYNERQSGLDVPPLLKVKTMKIHTEPRNVKLVATKSTMMGAMTPPMRPDVEQSPTAALLAAVGNNSVV